MCGLEKGEGRRASDVTIYSESRIVPYTADLMYSVVADMERYPDFLPWCTMLRIKSRMHEGDREVALAEMAVGFGGFRERYTSRVVLDAKARAIDVVQEEGVFRRLDTTWRFSPEGPENKSCRIDFSIDYEFKSRLLNAVAGAAFHRVARQMIHAYEARARKLAGR